MSREFAADIVVLEPPPNGQQLDLQSLNEGIALLARLEQILVDMHLSLDDIPILTS